MVCILADHMCSACMHVQPSNPPHTVCKPSAATGTAIYLLFVIHLPAMYCL